MERTCLEKLSPRQIHDWRFWKRSRVGLTASPTDWRMPGPMAERSKDGLHSSSRSLISSRPTMGQLLGKRQTLWLLRIPKNGCSSSNVPRGSPTSVETRNFLERLIPRQGYSSVYWKT